MRFILSLMEIYKALNITQSAVTIISHKFMWVLQKEYIFDCACKCPTKALQGNEPHHYMAYSLIMSVSLCVALCSTFWLVCSSGRWGCAQTRGWPVSQRKTAQAAHSSVAGSNQEGGEGDVVAWQFSVLPMLQSLCCRKRRAKKVVSTLQCCDPTLHQDQIIVYLNREAISWALRESIPLIVLDMYYFSYLVISIIAYITNTFVFLDGWLWHWLSPANSGWQENQERWVFIFDKLIDWYLE